MYKTMILNPTKFTTILLAIIALLTLTVAANAKLLDRIVAVVEDDVIMESELRQRVSV